MKRFKQISYPLSGQARFLPFLLLIWPAAYALGRHADAPWGDALGYAISLQEGWDLATNANSHFAWLASLRLIWLIPVWPNPLVLMGWASVFWASATLALLFFTVRRGAGSATALLSTTLLAAGFPFWRSATVPEVYTAEAFFWAGLLYAGEAPAGSRLRGAGLTLVHAIGLLFHIHLILALPYVAIRLLRAGASVRVAWPYLFFLAPVLVSVFVLGLHGPEAVFFDHLGPQMLAAGLVKKLAGPFLVLFLLAFYAPAGCILSIAYSFRPDFRAGLKHFFAEDDRLWLLIPVVGFAAWFPEPGIWVFLLPAWILLSCAWGKALAAQGYWLGLTAAAVLLNLAFYAMSFGLLSRLAPPAFRSAQELKGGIGFVTLPWAGGNVASLFGWVECRPEKVPASFSWNAVQVARWRRYYPSFPAPCRQKVNSAAADSP